MSQTREQFDGRAYFRQSDQDAYDLTGLSPLGHQEEWDEAREIHDLADRDRVATIRGLA